MSMAYSDDDNPYGEDEITCKTCDYRSHPLYLKNHERIHKICAKCAKDSHIYNGPYVFWDQEYNIESLCGIYLKYNKDKKRGKTKLLDIMSPDARMCCSCFGITHKDYPSCMCTYQMLEYDLEAYEETAEYICSFCFEEVGRWQTGGHLWSKSGTKSFTKFIKPQGCSKCLNYIMLLRKCEKSLSGGLMIYCVDSSEVEYNNRIHVNTPLFGHFEKRIDRYMTQQDNNLGVRTDIILMLRHLPIIKFSDIEQTHVAFYIRYGSDYIKSKLQILNSEIEKNLIETKKYITVVIPPLKDIVIQYIDCRFSYHQMIKQLF